MTLTEQRKPYEFLARWDEQTGQFKGAHIQYFDAVLRDGVIVSGSPSKAYGVGAGMAFPLADIMSQVTTDALALTEAQAATITAKNEALTAANTDKQAAEAARDAALARVAELEAQLAMPAAEVSMAQARIALHRAGKLDLIPAIIASLDEPPRIEAGIWWEFATAVRKDHPIVQMLAPALGLDDAGLDDLFAVAASV
jgi:hypothetical protein